METHYKTSNGH